MIIGVMSSAFVMLIYCYTGTATTENFLKLTEYAYDSKWYDCNNELKQYFVLIIANAQRPQIFNGLKMIDLSLGTFLKVNNFSCESSYKIIFKLFL